MNRRFYRATSEASSAHAHVASTSGIMGFHAR